MINGVLWITHKILFAVTFSAGIYLFSGAVNLAVIVVILLSLLLAGLIESRLRPLDPAAVALWILHKILCLLLVAAVFALLTGSVNVPVIGSTVVSFVLVCVIEPVRERLRDKSFQEWGA